MAKVTQRTELGPLRALPTVRQARIERGMRLGLAQCAQLTLTPDFVWDRDFRSGCDYEVAVAARQISTRRYRGSRRWVESAVRSLCRPVEVDYSRSQ